MLTLIAYHFALSGFLPRISYLTRADSFLLWSLILVFTALMEATATAALVNFGKEALALKMDKPTLLKQFRGTDRFVSEEAERLELVIDNTGLMFLNDQQLIDSDARTLRAVAVIEAPDFSWPRAISTNALRSSATSDRCVSNNAM